MHPSLKTVVALFLAVIFSGPAFSQTVVRLNTGYNHGTNAVYPVGQKDNYWINLATSPPTSPPADTSWNIATTGTPWMPALPGTNWISAWNSPPSHLVPVTNIGYTIFRKCFCMMSFSQAKLSFVMRGDDNITVWLNTTLNNLLPATSGRWNLSPISYTTSDQSKFRIGVNCLYVLLEDTGGNMGFDLQGTVSAFGLMPLPASGTATSFAPCGCDFPATPAPQTGGPKAARTAAAADMDEQKVIQDIIKIAEDRAKKRPPAKK